MRLWSRSQYSGNPTQHTKILLQSVIFRLNGKSNSPTQIFGLLFVPGSALEAHTRADCVWFCEDGRSRRETELGMSQIQHTREAEAAPRAVPRWAGLEHQHRQFYHSRMSGFLEPYQGVHQGWLLIVKNNTGQNLPRVNPLSVGLWAELNQPSKDTDLLLQIWAKIETWTFFRTAPALLHPTWPEQTFNQINSTDNSIFKTTAFSCPYFRTRAGALESSAILAARPHSYYVPPPSHLLHVQIHSCGRASLFLEAVTECSPCVWCSGNSCKVFPHPQKAQEQEIRVLHHPQSRRPWAVLVSLITAAQFTQPVENQTVCWLICPIPWLMAQGGKLGSTEERVQQTGLESNTFHRGLWPGTYICTRTELRSSCEGTVSPAGCCSILPPGAGFHQQSQGAACLQFGVRVPRDNL